MRALLFVFLLSISISSHAASYLDTQFTLPEGASHFSVAFGYYGQRPVLDAHTEPRWLFGLEYRKAIERDLEFVFTPLPTGIRYRLPSNENLERGVSWSLDFWRLGVWGVKPTFASYMRWRRGAHSALELNISYYAFYPFDGTPMTGSLQFSIGPVWQPFEWMALGANAGLSSGDYYLVSANRTDVPQGQAFDPRKSRLTAPLALFMDLRTVKSGLGARLDYRYYGLSVDPSDYENVVEFKLSKEW